MRWALLLFLSLSAPAFSASVTINVNAASTVTTFHPVQVFGTNTNHQSQYADYLNLQPQVQAAGTFFTRFPGGSDSDVYHWNGNGSYVSNIWVPSSTSFSPGHRCAPLYEGTSTTPYGFADDGLTTTAWVSHPDTDFPNAQWLMMTLGSSATTVNKVTIDWGSPYATSFQVQYWDPTAANQWNPMYDYNGHWLNTSAGTVAGTGGTQSVSFSNVSTQHLRLLLTGSSAGPGGVYSVAELRAFNGATQLSVNSAASSQSTVYASSNSVASKDGPVSNFDFEDFMAYQRSLSPAGIPIITVNFGTGTPQEAAAWVHYANVVRGYGIKYWEVGNELFGTWEVGGPLSAKDYARRYINFYTAMKAEDPSIVVMGPVAGFNGCSDDWDGRDYIEGFIKRLAADPGGDKSTMAEGISVHNYGPYNNNVDATLLAEISDIPAFATSLASRLTGTAAANAPVFLTEFNANSNASVITNHTVNALYTAHWLGQWIASFGPRANANFFALDGASNMANDATQGTFGAYSTSPGPYQYATTPGGWALQLMASDWCISGDASANSLVSCSSTSTSVVTYANLRPDGVLALLVSNEDSVNTYNGTINIAGFLPQGTAATYTMDSTTYQWQGGVVPYHAAPNTAPATGVQVGVSSSFSHSFAPYSMTVFQFHPQQTPTPTVTGTPPTPTDTPTLTQTPTASVTPTFSPTACASLIVYNGEPGAGNKALATGGNYTVSCSMAEDAAGAHAGTKGMDIHYAWTNYYADWAWNFANWSAGAAYNLSAYSSIELYVRCSSGYMPYLYLQLADAPGTNTSNMVNVGNYLFGGVNTTWQKVTVPLAAFSGLNMSSVGMVHFVVSGSQSGDSTVYLDDVYFRKDCPAGTPTDTPTASATRTLSPTRTASPSPSPSATPTASQTAPPASTPTLTRTSTTTAGSSTLTATPDTPTPTPSFSATPTVTATPSAGSSTATPVQSATTTITPGMSASSTPSTSPSSTQTGTATPSVTLAPPSFTPSTSASPTPTQSASPTASTTSVPSSPTATPTATCTSTLPSGSSPTSTLGPTPALTAGTTSGGTLRILQAVPYPNPGPSALAFLLDGPADAIELRLYSTAESLVGSLSSGARPSGWNSLALDPQWQVGLANGVYFARLQARRGDARSAAVILKLSWIR